MKKFFKSMADVANEAIKLSTNSGVDFIISQCYITGDYYLTSNENEIGSNDSIIEVYHNGDPLNINGYSK